MSRIIYVRPKAGLSIRNPDDGDKPLPEHGAGVTWSSYWERRSLDGDIVVADQKAVEAGATKAAAAPDAAASGTAEKGDAK